MCCVHLFLAWKSSSEIRQQISALLVSLYFTPLFHQPGKQPARAIVLHNSPLQRRGLCSCKEGDSNLLQVLAWLVGFPGFPQKKDSGANKVTCLPPPLSKSAHTFKSVFLFSLVQNSRPTLKHCVLHAHLVLAQEQQ